MHFPKYLKVVLLIVVFITTKSLYAQLSKTHYIPPLTSAEFGNANPEDQYIYLSTPSTADVFYTIKQIGLPATSDITGVVSNTNPVVISIGSGNGQLFVASSQTSTVTNKGYLIEAEDVIYASIRMNAGTTAQAGALVSKGLSALGTQFRVGTYTNQNPQNNYLNFVSVMATEDNTQVVFDNLPAGLMIKNYTGTIPVTVTLNENESYILATNSFDTTINRDGLIGCLVSSDKNIVVNCGSANGSFHNGNGRDYGIDQIVDVSKTGKEFIFVRGNGDNNWENILIVAHVDNTAISINGGAAITTINAGDYYLIEGDSYSANGNMYVETSQDAFAYQGVGGLSNNGLPAEANQGMFFVPPLSCEARGNIDNIANIDEIGATNYSGGLSIVTKTGASITVNNLPISNFSVQGPNAVTGNPNYETYKVTGLAGNISVQCDDELYCAYFNYNGAATSGSYYSGFPSIPEINYEADFATLGNCIPNITLSAANTEYFDNYQWWFDDGTGFVNLNISTPDYTPTIPGTYKLIGEILCSGLILESDEVPVSICPDDLDNDGIIDNIDIDNDNDGILNCIESNGNAYLNITDINQPQIVLQDGTISSIIVNGVFTQSSSSGSTNTFSGDNIGNFTSVVNPDASAVSDYSISFNENVHILLSEDISVSHVITSGAFFTVKITPLNKNITLIDPDDRLLIDTNFDGVFETGVTQISGSEIRFQVNPSPLGSTPYQFSANDISGFSFMHNLSNITDISTFQATLALSCFKLDSDQDGIEDALDLDSDNDGIPDFVESLGNNYVNLSGIDNDNNGLDDVFDVNGMPIDSDTDGVSDYLDLDSDNDGIHDLYETGQLGLLSDTDVNGVVDGPISNLGSNGWDDAAETTPDSGILGYTLNDADNDSNYSYLDLDSDGDNCSDVIEAGFSDANNDDLLGDNSVQVNDQGLVINASDGYTIPNSDYLDGALITIDAQPVDNESCEFSTTTISLLSSSYDTIQWEVSTDGINYNSIVDDANYGGSQTEVLTISNTPLVFDNYQYRAFLSLAGNSCGLYSDEIQLTVNLLPVANTASNILLCDDDNNGTMPFDLLSQNSFINTTPGMTITYHETQSDADTGSSPLVSPYESGNTTIYARVENDANTTCYDVSSFDLEVYESPFPLLNVTPLQGCDDTSVGSDTDGIKVFDLTEKEIEILNGQSSTDFTLTYFSDAGYINQILTPFNYSNATPDAQTIYVRMTNNAYNSCVAETFFNLEVFTLPVVNIPNTYSQCDDASNDGQAYFNLTLDLIKEEINPNYLAEGLNFTYYLTQIDAQNASNPILNPENYQDAPGFIPEEIWIRAENPNGCYREVPLTLVVNPSSAALASYSPTPLFQCDETGPVLRENIATFDLTNIRDYISNTIFSTFNVTVHFYESQTDAELETNEILDIANHQNINSPVSQSIWVRVKSDLGNNCLGLEEFPNLLNVEALPFANPVTITRQCDYDTTDAFVSFPFDTSTVESTVLNGQSLANVTVSYDYLDISGTPVTSNTLPNPFLTETQTITIIVTNNVTQDPDGACEDVTTLEFVVDQTPVANAVSIPAVCDDDENEYDGVYNFDTSTIESEILQGQTGFEVHYFDSLGTELSSPLPNPLITSTQTITAMVVNPINDSCFDTTDLEFVVNTLPDFTIETPQIVCSSDPTFTIELDPEEATLDLFNYEWMYQDGTVLSNAPVLTVSTPGTYTITLTKTDGSNCSRSREVYVNGSELANISQDDITVVDISNINSISINSGNNNLGLGDYEFALNNEFSWYQDESFFNNVPAGIHTLFVRDKNGCGTASIEISIIGHPKFFTPNGDGYNDTWNIKGISSNFQSKSTIYIFDRFGKLIKQLDPVGNGWDGSMNGYDFPSNDYWFKVLLEDGREFMGHFTLKR